MSHASAHALGLAEELSGRFDAPLNDEGVFDHEKINPKGFRRATVAEVEKVPEAVAIGDDVDLVELVLGVHDLGSLEDDLEGIVRSFESIQINELTANLWFDRERYSEFLENWCASCSGLLSVTCTGGSGNDTKRDR